MPGLVQSDLVDALLETMLSFNLINFIYVTRSN
jgi:hypothetical protein